jgi:hypothetical protein
LLQLAAGRDKIQVALKNESKRILLLLLSQLADYVNLTAQGNENNISTFQAISSIAGLAH